MKRGGLCRLVGEVPWDRVVISQMYRIPGAGGRWKSSALDETFAAGGQRRTAPLCVVKEKVFGAACSSAEGARETQVA